MQNIMGKFPCENRLFVLSTLGFTWSTFLELIPLFVFWMNLPMWSLCTSWLILCFIFIVHFLLNKLIVEFTKMDTQVAYFLKKFIPDPLSARSSTSVEYPHMDICG